jgi:hypothetical protein
MYSGIIKWNGEDVNFKEDKQFDKKFFPRDEKVNFFSQKKSKIKTTFFTK